MLKNYQLALMKPYFDAGLKSLAEACGYPVHAIKQCSQFKKTHHFILECWEAIYTVMLTKFLESSEMTETLMTRLMDDILDLVSEEGDNEFRLRLGASVTGLMQSASFSFDKFWIFIEKMCHSDETWKFWVQFVFVDALAYVGLFLALRSGDWQLRMISIKLMAPLFVAFDHSTYQKLISNHIHDLLNLPDSMLLMLSQGAFIVNICGREWHSVGIDEAHEMLINKQIKMSIVKPSEDYISRIASYITYRTIAQENLKNTLFPHNNKSSERISSLFSVKPNDKINEKNVQTQLHALEKANLFDTERRNCGLVNYFTNDKATEKKYHDLLNFRKIGEEEYQLRILYFILKQPSVKAPNRRRALQTFSHKQVNKKRVSQLEKDKKLLITAMKNKIQFAKKTGKPVENPDEQLVLYPLSLCDNEGNPNKGQKHYFTKVIENRYKSLSSPIIKPHFPSNWIPQCSIVEGMFLINTSPLPNHTTLADYGRFLLKRYIISQFKKGASEVHVIFDQPNHFRNTPKYFEQKRRDKKAMVDSDHTCHTISINTLLPHKKWRENYLNCRTCKRSLVVFLGNFFLQNASEYLASHQSMYIAGAYLKMT